MVPFGNFGWNFGFGFGWLVVILALILLVFGVMQLVRFMGGRSKTMGDETPLEVLKKRYARGEITKEEFEARKKEIL